LFSLSINLFAIAPPSQLSKKLFLVIFSNYQDISHLDTEDEFFPITAFRGLPYFEMRSFLMSKPYWSDMLSNIQSLDDEFPKLSNIQKRDIRLAIFFSSFGLYYQAQNYERISADIAYIVLSNMGYNEKYKSNITKLVRCQNFMIKFPHITQQEIYDLENLAGNDITSLYYMTLSRVKGDFFIDTDNMKEKLKILYNKMIQNNVSEYQKQCFDDTKYNNQVIANALIQLIEVAAHKFTFACYQDLHMAESFRDFDSEVGVGYFDDKKRQQTLVKATKHGKVLRDLPLTDGKYIWAMDSKGNMCVANDVDGKRFRFKYLLHSSFRAGLDLAAAGEIIIKDYMITFIDNQSGHYKPKTFFLMQALHNLILKGFLQPLIPLKLGIYEDNFITKIYNNCLYFIDGYGKMKLDLNWILNKNMSYAA